MNVLITSAGKQSSLAKEIIKDNIIEIIDLVF